MAIFQAEGGGIVLLRGRVHRRSRRNMSKRMARVAVSGGDGRRGRRTAAEGGNLSTISLIKNPVHHDRSKHIDVKYHYIRECAEKKLTEVMSVGTAEQLGDIFTKSLGRTRFQELRSKIGMCSLESGSQT